MENRSRMAVKIWIICVAAAAVALIFSMSRPEDPARSSFHERFNLALPAAAEAILQEDDYGWMGDGHLFCVYQLSPGDMREFLKQGAMARWSPLPIPEDTAENLHRDMRALLSQTAKEEEREFLQEENKRQGYYCLVNTWQGNPGRVLNRTKYDRDNFQFQNIALGIVDTQNKKIYYYTQDR